MTTLEILLVVIAVGAIAVAWFFRTTILTERGRHMLELLAQREERAAELQRQAERTAALFDRMVEGIIVVDANARVRLSNESARRLFGFNPDSQDRTILEATRHHEVAALVARLATTAEVLNHELRIEGVTATRFIQVNALALCANDGARDGSILVFHDLTRLRQLEAVRQEFVANVSHELRTPVSLIKSAVETLIDGGRNDAVITSRFLEIIDTHANRLILLIDDLLLLARLDSGRVELNLQRVSLRQIAQEALDDAAILARARSVMLENEVEIDVVANADPDRLRQVLANLIDNAIKYGRANGRVTLTGRARPGARVEVTVRDDGPGIPPEAKDRVFERFYRVDKARSREQGGTGLGLAIVKNVVQAHGGDVRLESSPHKGTEFFITLPAPERTG